MLNSEELKVVGRIVDVLTSEYAGTDRKRFAKKAVIAVTFAAIYSQDAFGIVIPKVVEQNSRLELNMGR